MNHGKRNKLNGRQFRQKWSFESNRGGRLRDRVGGTERTGPIDRMSYIVPTCFMRAARSTISPRFADSRAKLNRNTMSITNKANPPIRPTSLG